MNVNADYHNVPHAFFVYTHFIATFDQIKVIHITKSTNKCRTRNDKINLIILKVPRSVFDTLNVNVAQKRQK